MSYQKQLIVDSSNSEFILAKRFASSIHACLGFRSMVMLKHLSLGIMWFCYLRLWYDCGFLPGIYIDFASEVNFHKCVL